MKVLLTGITGFLARRIAHDLLAAGHHVRGSLRDRGKGEAVRALMPEAAAHRLEFVELDLTKDDGWNEAAQGTDAVIHTASPFPIMQTPADPQTIIRPAVEGTERALRAAKAAGVARVILTSSVVAVENGPRPEDDRPRDERDWSSADHPNANAYVRSKTEAERAAWAFAEAEGLLLTTICPGLVMGPPLGDEAGTSLGIIARILSGKDPMVPPVAFEIVDVRDVSRAHVVALETPATAGRRFLLVAGKMWFADIARIVAAEAPHRGISTRTAPRLLVRALAMMDPALRGLVPVLGRNEPISGEKARIELGIDYIPPDDAVRAAARAMIALDA
ncbi:NAD-dependent epimerase/dehydratase family protein [Jannaschia ovalis]|uniref:NAD-dependent epimerase/dehydratase family protein n=1 Tax=Jannaschia ovalis TaxID=3038773 RepID=A0ABY8LD35_9RHOB|nr:NAD-dependent epimerase/dehydratase family protein [Jannaschia sp. GRR-S6-38]WGH79206.1 NAD-dependent epimerase/dehydratase family protein [Jannaschia sp. GRR-S6-38]